MCRSSGTPPGFTAVLQDRRIGTEHMLQRPTTYLIAADGEPQQHPTTTPRHRHVDGPGVLYHTITAIVEADLTPTLRGRQVDIARTLSARGRTPSYWRMTRR
jgi:putative polyketide hydroxylase